MSLTCIAPASPQAVLFHQPPLCQLPPPPPYPDETAPHPVDDCYTCEYPDGVPHGLYAG